MRDYELMFVLNPQVEDERVPAVVERLSQFITSREGEVAKVDPWGRRKLAYPIDGCREGNYILMNLKLKPEAARELESSIRISEDILRHLLIRLDE